MSGALGGASESWGGQVTIGRYGEPAGAYLPSVPY